MSRQKLKKKAVVAQATTARRKKKKDARPEGKTGGRHGKRTEERGVGKGKGGGVGGGKGKGGGGLSLSSPVKENTGFFLSVSKGYCGSLKG
jgi:hypothetical protein